MNKLLVENVLDNLKEYEIDTLEQDRVILKWHECANKIIHATSENGRDIAFKRLDENRPLHHQDVIYKDDHSIIWIEIEPISCIVIKPHSMEQMAKVCYEIGNKHIPLFLEQEELLLPFEKPIFEWLEQSHFHPHTEERILDHALRSTLSSEHHHHD